MKSPQIAEKTFELPSRAIRLKPGVVIAIAAMGQFLALAVWSLIKWRHYAFTYDFAIYYQAAYLISHGNMNPMSTVLNFPFIQNDFEIIMWPIGWILHFVHSGLFLPLLQDFSLSAASWAGLSWMNEILGQRDLSLRDRAILQTLGAVFLFGTPWIYWTANFDVHIEPLVLPFVVLAGWNFWKGNRFRGYIWTVLFLLGGNVVATYAFGLGIMEILLGRQHRKNGIVLMILSALVLMAIEKFVPGGIKGGNLAGFYGYLISHQHQHVTVIDLGLGLLSHPQRALATLWAHRLNIMGEISPAGLLGSFSPIGLGISLVILLTDNLIGRAHNLGLNFGTPIYFQGIAVVPFVAVGTISLLSRFRTLFRRLWNLVWYGVVAALFANTIAWFVIFVPPIQSHLDGITSQAARVLSSIQPYVSHNQQVVSTQAFVGRFAARDSVQTFVGGTAVHIAQHHVIVLVSPYQGVEVSPVTAELARIWNAATLPGSKLIEHGGGIWAFNYYSQATNYDLNLGRAPKLYPAWALKHPAGRPLLFGPVSRWHMASSGSAGYVVDGFYKRLGPGVYNAVVNLSTTTPVTLEVWNDTGAILLRRDTIVSTGGVQRTIKIPFSSPKVYPHSGLLKGYGPWQITPPPPPAKDQLEIRIWTSGHGLVNIYGLNILANTPSNLGRS